MDKNKTSHAPNVATEMENEMSFWLAKSLKSVTSGSVELYASDKPALKMEVAATEVTSLKGVIMGHSLVD